jgi:hypothetical protein
MEKISGILACVTRESKKVSRELDGCRRVEERALLKDSLCRQVTGRPQPPPQAVFLLFLLSIFWLNNTHAEIRCSLPQHFPLLGILPFL